MDALDDVATSPGEEWLDEDEDTLTEGHPTEREDDSPWVSITETNNDILECLKKPLFDMEELGCVYVLTDSAKPSIVKIGLSKNPRIRTKQLKLRCGLPDLSMTWISGKLPILLAKKVEKLSHHELRFFKRPYDCSCGSNHGEYFEVSKDVAKVVVQRWISFIYSANAYAGDGRLQPGWAVTIGKYIASYESEQKHKDHVERHEWWEKLRQELASSPNAGNLTANMKYGTGPWTSSAQIRIPVTINVWPQERRLVSRKSSRCVVGRVLW